MINKNQSIIICLLGADITLSMLSLLGPPGCGMCFAPAFLVLLGLFVIAGDKKKRRK